MWKFWRNKKQSPAQIQLNVVQQQLSALELQSTTTNDLITWIAEKITTSNEQTLKWSRSQYKSAQDIQARLDKLDQAMDDLQQNNLQQELTMSRTTTLEDQLYRTSLSLIGWIDDMDHLRANLQETENEGWTEILLRWTDQLSTTLSALDIHELEVQHHSFDPQLAEAIDTLSMEQLDSLQIDITGLLPFQVISVVRRGYVQGQRTILRKAQVITLEHKEE